MKHIVICGFSATYRLINNRFDRLEDIMSQVREDFDETLTELGGAITELSTRIDNIPDAEDITQADIDALKASVANINALAVSAPTIPTPEPGEDTEPTPEPA